MSRTSAHLLSWSLRLTVLVQVLSFRSVPTSTLCRDKSLLIRPFQPLLSAMWWPSQRQLLSVVLAYVELKSTLSTTQSCCLVAFLGCVIYMLPYCGTGCEFTALSCIVCMLRYPPESSSFVL